MRAWRWMLLGVYLGAIPGTVTARQDASPPRYRPAPSPQPAAALKAAEAKFGTAAGAPVERTTR
jgi:hypothetical protein